MIRLLIAVLGLPVLPAFLALSSWVSPSAAHAPRFVWAPSHPAVWEIQAGRDAEMEALKDRIEVLQGRVAATNQKLTAALAALESDAR